MKKKVSLQLVFQLKLNNSLDYKNDWMMRLILFLGLQSDSKYVKC